MKKLSKSKIATALTLIILLAMAGGFLVSRYQLGKKEKMEIATEQEKKVETIVLVQQPPKTPIESDDSFDNGIESEGSYIPAGDGMYWFIVKEMGIKFKVKKELKDDGLTYYYEKGEYNYNNKPYEWAFFSTKELEKIDKNCSAKNSRGVFGSLIKIKGKIEDYKNDIYVSSRNPKQFKDFIIYRDGSGDLCTSSDILFNKKNNFLGKIMSEALNTIQPIE